MSKQAIVVANYGTTNQEAFERCIQSMEDHMKHRFPDFHVESAYTSELVIRRIKERDGLQLNNVGVALTKLCEAGYDTIYVQPSLMIPGSEFGKIHGFVMAARRAYPKVLIKLGRPLLYNQQDYEKLVDVFEGDMSRLTESEALILMGHGTKHFANAAYFQLQYFFKRRNHNTYITLVEADPGFEEIRDQVLEKGIKKVIIAPLLMVAGNHALKDMASDNEGSLKWLMEEAGIHCELNHEGLMTHTSVREILCEHLLDLMED